ncbi:PhoH family protein [Vagococcus fluvialis]|uniref:PhoH-like protein n=1 Tax=Vagococcus fluvialis TaxID=2738 RepID=A0A7X6I3I7_9ENTE|nr:PhoH family protein [Vagococcus fluvialis]MBO0443549.1 PhoH family protein [Vagococcus fluvialis]MBO0479017.1 PhoH family protein [Vagococcus fluvialis]MBO0484091.1 PhoH family protein [Vagococcus fluvialis]MBO0485975.1 PhoH family protein [Vagococcus fluvialis]MCM2137711.1 PhoH family protein [Vagococcus fluvialis]
MATVDEYSIDIRLDEQVDVNEIFGAHDKNIKLLEDYLNLNITSRGEFVRISGEELFVNYAREILKNLQKLTSRGHKISTTDVVTSIQMAKKGELDKFLSLYEKTIIKDAKGNPIRPKNLGQKTYVEAIKKNDVVFGMGPAGTGKTFLAVCLAVAALKNGEVEKIILTRPAVEAGESLGFLPGDLQEKVNPYLRPIYDALYMILGMDHTNRLMERGVIEIAPLAYMRGRTLEECFVILDEAQNTTKSQMKMFLTRLGNRSKMVINGDQSQIDLPRGVESGLVHANSILRDIQKIKFVEFSVTDVVRHPVVADIINAYSKN